MINFNTKKWLWVGRIVSAASGLFMLFDASIHLVRPPAVIQAFQGYPSGIILPLAIVELVCVVLYIIPKTSVFGAILLTGYLGGAVDYNVRAGNSFFTWIMAPIYIAIALWIGLYLRNEKLRAAITNSKDKK